MICLGGRVGWTASEDAGGPGSTAEFRGQADRRSKIRSCRWLGVGPGSGLRLHGGRNWLRAGSRRRRREIDHRGWPRNEFFTASRDRRQRVVVQSHRAGDERKSAFRAAQTALRHGGRIGQSMFAMANGTTDLDQGHARPRSAEAFPAVGARSADRAVIHRSPDKFMTTCAPRRPRSAARSRSPACLCN